MPQPPAREIELLAPARDAATGIEAVTHGADAVYIGASHFGARAAAANDTADIARLCDFAHRFGAKVYATVNTIIHDSELLAVERLVHELYRAQVDAIIVQDMGLLRLDLPPIALHASTQCDLRTVEKAKFLEALGFSQLVLARELTLAEISDIAHGVSVPLEAFVHGALCVSYSGRCHVSEALHRRSANRGECAQVCRLPFSLVDEQGRELMKRGQHLLSLRDLNASKLLRQMIDAGVSSFKIEGRLKDAQYVKNVVAHYRREIDRVIDSDKTLTRASQGSSELSFTPDPNKSFNRAFTTYFLERRKPDDGSHMASLRTPKSLGERLGTVSSANGRMVEIDTQAAIGNGDGLSYFNSDGVLTGFRVNTAHGRRVEANAPQSITRGTTIYRTADSKFSRSLAKTSATRTVAVRFSLRTQGQRLCLEATDERGNRVSVSSDKCVIAAASTPQGEKQRKALGKTGGTIYRMDSATVLDDVFVPISQLTQLRRDALAALDKAQCDGWQRPKRREEDLTARCPQTSLSFADNVANHLARQLYEQHGVSSIEPALECRTTPVQRGTVVMTTRYCIRRELGACLKGKNAHTLPKRLMLQHGNVTLEVKCRCDSCEMQLLLDKA